MVSVKRLLVSLTLGAILLVVASVQARADASGGDHLEAGRAAVTLGLQSVAAIRAEVEDGVTGDTGLERALQAIDAVLRRRAEAGLPGRGPIRAFDVLTCKQEAEHPSDCAPPHRIDPANSGLGRIAGAYRVMDELTPRRSPEGGGRGQGHGRQGHGNSPRS